MAAEIPPAPVGVLFPWSAYVAMLGAQISSDSLVDSYAVSLYRIFFDSNTPVDWIFEDSPGDWSQYKAVLLSDTIYPLNEKLISKAVKFAKAGGRLIIAPHFENSKAYDELSRKLPKERIVNLVKETWLLKAFSQQKWNLPCPSEDTQIPGVEYRVLKGPGYRLHCLVNHFRTKASVRLNTKRRGYLFAPRCIGKVFRQDSLTLGGHSSVWLVEPTR